MTVPCVGIEALREVHVPARGRRVAVRSGPSVVVRGSVVDDVELARVARDRPRKDRRLHRGAVHLDRRRPGLAAIGRDAVVDVTVVREDGVHVSRAVDGHVRELMVHADPIGGTDVDGVVGELRSAVGRDGHPDGVVLARQCEAAASLAGIRNSRQYLVDDVRLRVDGQVPDLIVLEEERVRRVDCTGSRVLREDRPAVVAAVDVDVEGGEVVIRDAHLARPVGGDPLAIVTRDRRSGRVELPGCAAVGARAHVDVGEAEARDVDVVEAAFVLDRGGRQVGIAAARRESRGAGRRILVR